MIEEQINELMKAAQYMVTRQTDIEHAENELRYHKGEVSRLKKVIETNKSLYEEDKAKFTRILNREEPQ